MKSNILPLILALFFATSSLPATAQKPPASKPVPARQTQKQRSTWEAIISLFRAKGRNLGSRGVCPVSPGLLEEKNVIWSARPLFLWQGISLPLEIRLYSPFTGQQEQEIIWGQEITAASSDIPFQGVEYTGEALEPGKIYDWAIFDPNTKYKLRRSFQVMSLEEREPITKELESLENRLKSEGATDEEITRERANYFAQKELWSDTLQAMYSVTNPSAELTSKIQELLKELCEPSSP